MSHFLRAGSGTTITYSPSNTKFSIKYLNISQNQQKLFQLETISMVMPKNTNKTEKPGQILI